MFQFSHKENRGEVSALLTIISMAVILGGVIFGSNGCCDEPLTTGTDASEIGSVSIFDRIGRIFTSGTDQITIPEDSIQSNSPATVTPTPINKDPKSIWFRRQAGGEICGGGFVCVSDPHVRKVELRRPDGSVIMELDEALASNYISGLAGETNILTPYGIRIDKCPNTTKGISVEYNPDDIEQYYSEGNQSPIKNLLVDRNGNRLLEPEDVIILSVTSNTRPPTLHFIYEKIDTYEFGSEEVTLYFEYDATIGGETKRYSQTAPILPGCLPEPSLTPTPTDGPTPTNTPTPTDGPTPTNTPTPTDGPTPTETPTPTPTTQACSFKSLAFVQECTEWVDKDRGICKRNAEGFNIGKPVVEEQYELSSDIPQHDLGSSWSLTNNLDQSGPFTYYKDLNGQNITASYFETEDFDASLWNDLEADITIDIDEDRYQFLPSNGKEVRKSAPIPESDRFASFASDQDTVNGLTVACGQDIVYGWTLQRCEQSFDYVFVMDTSTSMSRFEDPFYGKAKIDVMRDNMEIVLDSIGADGSNSRAALVQFNKTSRVLSDFSTDFGGLKNTAIFGLDIAEGTCQECGLEEAYNLIQNRQDKSRPPVVVFLSDGLPNSNPGGPHPQEGYEPRIDAETAKLDAIEGITIAAIGYGNPTIPSDLEDLPGAQLFRIITKIATDETWAFSTDTSKASASGSINEIYSRITSRLNSCAKTTAFVRELQKSKDVNEDGIINSLDLILIYDAYFVQDDIPEDINNDSVVNSLDSSLVLEDIGVVIVE